ncbi:MAG: hypothetical protein KAS32_17055 [Candidatus Peribacteraceae bacterium]|nr:hypothetical protein [Candidatus Peribacteraceae bacterium]
MSHGYVDDAPGGTEWWRYYDRIANNREKKRLDKELALHEKHKKKWEKMLKRRGYDKREPLFVDMDLRMRGEGIDSMVGRIVECVQEYGDVAITAFQDSDIQACR